MTATDQTGCPARRSWLRAVSYHALPPAVPRRCWTEACRREPANAMSVSSAAFLLSFLACSGLREIATMTKRRGDRKEGVLNLWPGLGLRTRCPGNSNLRSCQLVATITESSCIYQFYREHLFPAKFLHRIVPASLQRLEWKCERGRVKRGTERGVEEGR